jgi:hypothetical protein
MILVTSDNEEMQDIRVEDVIQWLKLNMHEAQDTLLYAKISQGIQANVH